MNDDLIRSHVFIPLPGGQPAEQLQVHQVPEGVLVRRVSHRDAVPVVRTHGTYVRHNSVEWIQ